MPTTWTVLSNGGDWSTETLGLSSLCTEGDLGITTEGGADLLADGTEATWSVNTSGTTDWSVI